jgi:hypothetical protein
MRSRAAVLGEQATGGSTRGGRLEGGVCGADTVAGAAACAARFPMHGDDGNGECVPVAELASTARGGTRDVPRHVSQVHVIIQRKPLPR